MVFVLRTYFFLPDVGAAVAFGVDVGAAVAFGFGVTVAMATKGSALESLIRAFNVSADDESVVIVIRPASVKG